MSSRKEILTILRTISAYTEVETEAHPERSMACLRSPAKDQRTLNPTFQESVISPVEAFSNLQSENTKMPMTLVSCHLPQVLTKLSSLSRCSGPSSNCLYPYFQTLTVVFYRSHQCREPETLPVLTLALPNCGALKWSWVKGAEVPAPQ